MGLAKQLGFMSTHCLLRGWFHSKPQVCLTQVSGGASTGCSLPLAPPPCLGDTGFLTELETSAGRLLVDAR